MIKPLLFLDCDGVCSDFVGAALDIAQGQGHNVTRDQVVTWNFYDAWPAEVRHVFLERCKTADFWANLVPIAQTYTWDNRGVFPDEVVTLKDCVNVLAEYYEVIVATSPWWSCPVWRDVRVEWIRQHLGVPERRVMVGASKYTLGDGVMIEDNIENLRRWLLRGTYEPGEARNPRRGLLVAHPYNSGADLSVNANTLDIARVGGLDEAVAYLAERGWPRG